MTYRRRFAARRFGIALAAIFGVSCAGGTSELASDSLVIVTSESSRAPTEVVPATTEADSTTAGVMVEQSPATANPGDAGTPEPAPVVSDTTEPAVVEPSTDAAAELTIADLVLSDRGIGSFEFGMPIVRVIDDLTGLLGSPMSDMVAIYSSGDAGRFVDEDGFAFDHPYGRQTCFAIGLCVESGAFDTADLRLVGWNLTDGDGEGLATAAGLRLGESLGDSTGVVIDPVGCSVFGTGRLGGLELELLSTDGPFPSDAEDVATPTPPAAALIVVGMSAGSLRSATFASC